MPDKQQAIGVWLTMLPVIEDQEEAPHVYSYFCELIETQNPLIVNNVNMMVRIMAEAFATGVIDETNSQGKRMLIILQHLEQNKPLFDKSIESLNAELRASLEQVYSRFNSQK